MISGGHPCTHLFVGLLVRDRDAALAWYERLLDRPADRLPTPDEAVWQVAATGSIYLLADPSRAGQGEAMLVVDDLDAQRARLRAAGVSADRLVIVPGAGRKLRIHDPDGNVLWFAEVGAAGDDAPQRPTSAE